MIIILDFDSTIFPFESLEDLIALTISNQAQKKQIIHKMQTISDKAMNGDLDFKQSINQRLNLTKLDKALVQQYIDLRKQAIDHKIKNCLLELKKNHHIYIVSGGFIDYIFPLCSYSLNLEKKNIFANQFSYQNDQIIGFDGNNPLIETAGKVAIAQQIKQKHPKQKVLMIGDGYTDYLVYAKGLADQFIGVGYYQKRKKVELKAKYFCYTIDQLINYLKNIEE